MIRDKPSLRTLFGRFNFFFFFVRVGSTRIILREIQLKAHILTALKYFLAFKKKLTNTVHYIVPK